MPGVSAALLAGLLAGWRTGGPAERQLAATVRALVLDGRLPLESRVPAERELAGALGISRSTVTAAYNRLRRDGYLRSRQGAGSWVTMPGGHRAATDGFVPASGLDLQDRRVARSPRARGSRPRRCVRSRAGSTIMATTRSDCPPARGDRAALQRARPADDARADPRHQRRSAGARPCGAGDAPPRSRAVAELPTYPAALDALRAAGRRARLHVPVGAGGWDLEQFEALAERGPRSRT